MCYSYVTEYLNTFHKKMKKINNKNTVWLDI